MTELHLDGELYLHKELRTAVAHQRDLEAQLEQARQSVKDICYEIGSKPLNYVAPSKDNTND